MVNLYMKISGKISIRATEVNPIIHTESFEAIIEVWTSKEGETHISVNAHDRSFQFRNVKEIMYQPGLLTFKLKDGPWNAIRIVEVKDVFIDFPNTD